MAPIGGPVWPARPIRQNSPGIHEVPVTGDAAIRAATLPDFHADPADRLIVAAAMTTDAALVTADHRILEWRGALARHDARR